MIHRTFDQMKGTPNFVEADGFVSARLAVASDNLGFTVTEAIGSPEIDLEVEHKNLKLHPCLIPKKLPSF